MTKTNRRQIFLEHFLCMLGAERIEITKAGEDKVFGKVIYPDDNDHQEFCWHMSENEVPRDEVIELMQIIKTTDLMDIDKLTVGADELYRRSGWADYDRFSNALDKLFGIEIRMIDEGEETDSFFIHD